MGLVAKAGGDKEFELAPAGSHLGRCYMVVDLGTQDTTFKGQSKKSHKILIGWELPTELMSDGRPFAVSSRYTLSLFEQAILRQHLESWRGQEFTEEELTGFDIRNILGHYCLLSIVHNKQGDKTYANVAGVMKLPKGMEKPPAVNANLVFDIEEGDINILPEWLQNIVKKSDEWKAKNGSNGASNPAQKQSGKFDDMEDDIPFASSALQHDVIFRKLRWGHE